MYSQVPAVHFLGCIYQPATRFRQQGQQVAIRGQATLVKNARPKRCRDITTSPQIHAFDVAELEFVCLFCFVLFSSRKSQEFSRFAIKYDTS